MDSWDIRQNILMNQGYAPILGNFDPTKGQQAAAALPDASSTWISSYPATTATTAPAKSYQYSAPTSTGKRNRYAELMAQYQQAQPFSFTGYPSTYTGGYDVSPYQPYVAPVNRYAEIMGQGTMTGGSGRPIDYNPAWTALSDTEKAAFYAKSPIFSGITQFGQKVLGALPTPSNLLQQKLAPDFVARQKLIARGIDPVTGRDLGGDAFGNPLSSFGFVQAPGESGRGMPAPTGGFAVVTPEQRARDAEAAVAAAQAAEAARQPVTESPRSDDYSSRIGPGGGGGGSYSGAPSAGSDVGRSQPGSAHEGQGGSNYSKGGHVSMMHLQGPNPMGPDDGYGALKDGEYVINDKAVKKYGIELMNAINTGKISKGKLRGLLEM